VLSLICVFSKQSNGAEPPGSQPPHLIEIDDDQGKSFSRRRSVRSWRWLWVPRILRA
jgi:hypothetical protein